MPPPPPPPPPPPTTVLSTMPFTSVGSGDGGDGSVNQGLDFLLAQSLYSSRVIL